MPLAAEVDIKCEHLPFVRVARTLPDATLVLALQFSHDGLPLFVLSVTDGDQATVEETFEDRSLDILEAIHSEEYGSSGYTRLYVKRQVIDWTSL